MDSLGSRGGGRQDGSIDFELIFSLIVDYDLKTDEWVTKYEQQMNEL